MQRYRATRQSLFLLAWFSCCLWFSTPQPALAGDAGTGRRVGAIAEIELGSAVYNSTKVRSLATQEGLAGPIEIRDLTTATVLGSGAADSDGQYAIKTTPLVASHVIQAVHTGKQYFSSGVKVTLDGPPSIDEPLRPGLMEVSVHGTQGRSIRIEDATTHLSLGSAGIPPGPGPGEATIALTAALRLFQAIRAVDETTDSSSKIVPVLDLRTKPSVLPATCSLAPGPTVTGNFRIATFGCKLANPRGIVALPNGNALIVAGAAPADPGFGAVPAGMFQFIPETRKLVLFAPVTGVALERASAGPFGNDFFVARPRLFNIRGAAFFERGDGEIFRINVAPQHPIDLFARLLNFAPTGLAFDSPGGAFSGDMLVSSFLGKGLRRITSAGLISSLTNVPGLQGLAIGPGAGNCTATMMLYAAQPGGGQVVCIAADGSFATFADGMSSPIDVAFGPGGAFGTDLYVSDAGSGEILRVDNAGVKTTFASGFKAPFGLAFRDDASALFAVDYATGDVAQITPQ